MPNLNDLQTILLSTASQRDTGSLLPAPESVANSVKRVATAITALINAGFAEERETTDLATVHRGDGDLRYGVFITDDGRAAIGVGDDGDAGGATSDDAPAAEAIAPSPAPRATKTAAVIALLQRDDGATIAELIAATGWLPHTTRATLTGIRKKGYAVEKSKRGTQTCYHITGTAA